MSEAIEEFYPELRKDYSNKIGLAGEMAINFVLADYDVIPHLLNEPGVDVEVENLSLAVEIWNHSKQHAYLERLKSVIRNLSNYSFKFHVVSFISPEFRKIEEADGITVIELGFQIIPVKYLTFYQQYYSLKGKKTLNKKTARIIANKLKPLFNAIKKQQNQKTMEQIKDIPQTGITRKNIHSHVCSTSYSILVPIVSVSFSFVSMIYCEPKALQMLRKEADCNGFSVNKSRDSKLLAIHFMNTVSSEYDIGRMLRMGSSDPPLF